MELTIRKYVYYLPAGGWSDDLGITEGAEDLPTDEQPIVEMSITGDRVLSRDEFRSLTGAS